MAVTVSAMFIPVHDPDAALGFYRDALGLEVRNDVASDGFRWVTVGGQGSVLQAEGVPSIVLRPTGAFVSLPFLPYHDVRGREGRTVSFVRTRLTVTGEAVLRAGEGPVARPDAPPAMDSEMEPENGGDR